MQKMSRAGILIITFAFCSLGLAKPDEKRPLQFKPTREPLAYLLECKRTLTTQTTLGENTESLEESTRFDSAWLFSVEEKSGVFLHVFQPTRLCIVNNAGSEQETIMTVTAETMELKRGEKTLRKDATRNTPYAGLGKWRATRTFSSHGIPAGDDHQSLGEQASLAELFPLIMPDWMRLSADAAAPGDPWKHDCPFINVDKEDALNMLIPFTFEIAGFDSQDGHRLARINFSGTFSGKTPVTVNAVDGVKIEFEKIEQDVSGFFDFDLDDGTVLLMTATVDTAIDYSKTLTHTSLPPTRKSRVAHLEFKWQLDPQGSTQAD